MEPQEARTGTMVRVKEGYRKTDLVGMRGTVQKCGGHPDYAAVDVRLEDGRKELLWFHQLEVVKGSEAPSGAKRLLRWWPAKRRVSHGFRSTTGWTRQTPT
jgi:hypothetical protein